MDIITALTMRCNYIETGTIAYGAADVQNMGKHAPREAKIQALSDSQMETLLRMRNLKTKLLSPMSYRIRKGRILMLQMEKKFPIMLGKVCGRCMVDKSIPVDMTRAPRSSNCDECQQTGRTYRRLDNEEVTTAESVTSS
jgi:hypothetical protein